MLSVGDVLIFSDNAILSIEHLDGTIAQLPSLELELADDQADAEIASLQALIASGEDPTQVAEASAAGIAISGNSGGFGFTSVERNAKEVIAQAGYDTTEINQRPAAASFEKTTNYSLSSPSAPQSPKDKNDSKVNKLPNAVNDQVKVDEDGRITLDLTKNDNDADGSFKITAIASIELTGKEQIIFIDNGQIEISAEGNIVFVPDTNFNGDVSFDYTITDDDGASATATVAITVKPVNDAPEFIDDNNSPAGGNITAETEEDIPVSGQLMATDADGDELNFALADDSLPSNGLVNVNKDGSWEYTPNTDFNGEDNFDVIVNDGKGGTDTITVNITVKPANVDPVIVDNNGTPLGDSIVVTTDEEVTVDGSLSATDADADGDTLTFTQSTDPANGKVTVDANGNWTYDPHPDFHGNDKFDVIVSDGKGGTDTITVNITVNPINDAPVIVDNSENKTPLGDSIAVTTDEDVKVSGTLSATDADDDTLTFTQSTDPKNGTVTVDANGNWTYDPNPDFHGSDKFDVIVSDGKGGTDTITVNITVNPINDKAEIGGEDSRTIIEADTILTADGQLTVNDVDNTDNVFQELSGIQGEYGTFNIDAAGNWTFEANSAFDELNVGDSLTDSFVVKSIDGTEHTVTVTIDGTNDAAVISGVDSQTLPETDAILTTGGQLTASDVDNPDNTFQVQSGVNGQYGIFNIDAAGNWTFEANSAFNELNVGDSLSDSFVVASIDGSEHTVTVTIDGTNDAAVILGVDSQTLPETDAILTTGGQLTAVDVDNPDNTFQVQSSVKGQYGIFNIDAAGNWTFEANSAFNELNVGDSLTDSFVVASIDDTEHTVTVTIDGTNDAAVISGVDSQTFPETDAILTTGGQLTAADVDNPDNTFQVQSSVKGQYGIFNIDAAGNWTFEANSAFNELNVGDSLTDSFVVASIDGTKHTVTVTIKGTNDDAVISGADNKILIEEADTILTTGGQLKASDVDNPDDTFQVQSGVKGQYGIFNIDTAGNWTFKANSVFDELNVGDSLTDSFVVKSIDGTEHRVTVTINGINDTDTTPSIDSQILTETDTILTTGGQLTVSDVDNPDNTFHIQSGFNGQYGTFNIDAAGNWTFEANSAFDELNVGDSLVDSFVVVSLDGTEHTVTVTINGTNDVAVISGVDSQTLTETDAILTTGGQLTASDVDNLDNTFQVQSGVNGEYGIFNINATGTWTFEANSAFDKLNVGESLTDSFVVRSIDGTKHTVTVTINGTNDAAVISGVDSQTLPETDAILTTGGQLTASDVDNPDNTFQVQSSVKGQYGIFNIDAAGNWTFEANSAFNELNVGDSLTDSFVVTSIDGTEHTVTVTIDGTNDAAVISGVDSQTLPETDAILTTGGQLTARDVDNPDNTFQVESSVKGQYGIFNIDVAGNWTFEANSTFNELNVGDSLQPKVKAALDEAILKRREAVLNYNKDVRAQLNEMTARLSRLTEAQVGSQDKVDKAVLHSPVNGTIKTINITTIGGVVKPGEAILDIVPTEDNLLIEAKVQPKDIAFLHPGLPAIVKVTAYDFTRYGGLDGTVVNISADTSQDEEGNSYYLVKVRTSHSYLTKSDQTQMPIIPGMLTSVDVITGKRTVLEYILNPILRAKEMALRER
ncbi:HlyD family type I secretion periplasmic adaptor subunit [Photobacterium leiognathi]|uniref:HlyD family type I secretion periplasmic adaptor subunit n=1 Tax=Photobacterium leiognathi TaxID=553611 RepID=UPI0027387B31|nr:HlyD family type I secretion periplasmic adaptor subunit [Photobacterium leiognathi]